MTENPGISRPKLKGVSVLEECIHYKHITVAGSGVLGRQIAYQTAYQGFCVNVYDISDEVLGHAKELLTKLKENYKEGLGATQRGQGGEA